jgi:hypothetical protein
VSHADWLRQNVTATYEKENSNIPDSKLIPSLTHTPVSVRWSAQPGTYYTCVLSITHECSYLLEVYEYCVIASTLSRCVKGPSCSIRA